METGINLVTVVENEKGARVAVTVINTPTPNLSLNSRTLPFTTSKSIVSQKLQISSTAQTEKVKQPTINNGIQICDDRFASSYQVAHCHVRSTSPPLVPTEFPQLSAPKTKNEKRHPVTRDPDYFVDSLRKYPQALTDLHSSTELIERVLSASLSKRVNKERAKHSAHRSKCTKENASKIIQTYTRSRKGTKNNINDGNHIIMATTARRSSSTMSRNRSLRDTSPRVQQMGRVAEIRYLTDVRKCIRDAIKHVWEEDETVCPNIQERFVVHQQQHHNPSSNKGEILQTKSKDVKVQELPDRKKKSKICPVCLNILPCHCRKKAKSIIRGDVANYTKFNNQSPSNILSSNSCCRNCREKREYKMKVYKQVLEWLQQIPFNANCSCDDKIRRLSIMRELINSLVEFRGMEGKQKEEIKKCLDIMPMWQPTDQFDRDLFVNTFVENLVARLNSLCNDNNSLIEIVSNWINETLINKMPYKDSKAKGRILHTIIDRIKSLKLDEVPKKDKAKQLLEKEIIDILKDIPLDQTPDVNFLGKAANSLVENITVTLPIDNSTIKSTSEIDYTNIIIKSSQENRQWSNFNDEQIFLNNLENSKQYYKFHKQTQTSDSIDPIADNKEEFIEAQTIQRYVEKKLLDVLEELPFNINANSTEKIEKQIIKEISKDLFLPSPLIKMESTEYDSKNSIGAIANFNHSVLLSELPTRQENIQDYVEKVVASIFNQYGIKYYEQIKMKNELTDLLTDQIIRGDNPESVKNTACSILREINISESQAEELCNTILQHVKNTSLIPHDTPPVSEKNLSSYQNKNGLLSKTEREIIHFINENPGLNDPVIKQKILKSIRLLTEDIENLISSTKPCIEDKENLITNKVFNFFKREVYPTDETLYTFAKALAKRLLLIPLQSSTPKAINNECLRPKIVSPTISIYHQDDEHKDNESFKENNEKIYFDIISKEVSKWVEKLPSDYKRSQDTRHHEMLAKELAKIVLISLANPSLKSDLVLNHEIPQWLVKIVKEPNQAYLQFLTEDVKETIKQKLQSVNLLPKPRDNQNHFAENLKHTISDWLKKSQILQNKNMQEKLLRESLVSTLARDINNIMFSNVSASNIVNTDEQVLKAIQTRIKQFTMDPELKYNEKHNRDLSRQLLNSLKNLSMDKGTDALLEEVNENSKLALISNEVLRWIENIPSNYKVSNDKYHHKMLAKEIATRVLASMSFPNAEYNSLLDREIFQWLPKIVKPLNDVDLQFVARDLKETIKQKLPSENILLTKTPDSPNNLTEDLKENILDWLKMTQMHHTGNMQESLVSILARDLNDLICGSSSTDSGINKGELIMKRIQSYIKQITMDPKLKNNDKYVREMAFQLLNHLTKIPYKKVKDASFEESDEKSKLGLVSNEVLKWIDNIPSNYKLSHDKRQHKVLAKEIAKRIMAPILIPNSKSDLFLERELVQWLPSIVKYSNQGDLQFLAEELKKTIQQKLPSDIILISKSLDDLNINTENLKESIIDWLKNTQKEHKSNIHENLLRESLASYLARDLNNIIFTKKSANSTINMDEQMMRAIQTRIKQFTKDPKLKYNDKYTREMSFRLLNHLKKLHFDKETDASIEIINESIHLGTISNEVFKWMENIPSYYKLSHNEGQIKMLAKEISKKVQTPTSTPSLTSDLVLEREILQWLPKILKKINEADLQLAAKDLKETIKQHLPTDVISIWKFSDDPNQFTENLKDIILCWLHNTHMYKTGNSQEELLQKSLISNLAKDLNDIICVSSSTASTVNKEELMMKAIQTRIKQFTMDPQLKYNKKYNQEAALKLLKYLKQLPFDKDIDASLENLTENTKLGVVSNEIFRWIQNVPSDYKVSSNKHHHKILAKEISKRVQSPTFSSNQNDDSLLEHELLQWLPKIIKYSTESDLQFITKDLKETIKRKLPDDVTLVSESPGSRNHLTNTLKRNILNWLKNIQTYQTRNMQEKHLQESLVSNLAKDLNDILCDKNCKNSDVSNDEVMLNAIETYIKKFPMEPKLKYNNKHHRKMALELLKYINKLRNSKSSSLTRDELKSIITSWLHNLPLTSTPDYENASDKLCSIFSMVLKSNLEDRETVMYLKNEVINLLQDLPLNDDFRSYDKLHTLADKLIKSFQYVPTNMNVHENLLDHHTNINNGESTLKHAVMSYEQIPVTNTHDQNLDKQRSHLGHKENYLLRTKVGQNETNFADKNITANTIEQNEEILHQHFASGEIPVDFEGQHKNRKNVEEIQKKLTSGLINILDKLNINSNLVNETVDENILKHDIENLIDALSKNVEHKKMLLPLKQDIVNITKEIAEINKKLLAEKDLKVLLHGVIDNTLPTTSHFSKQKTSFEDLKEKLIDAFINLNQVSNVNTHKYKEDLKKEVNKFCHDYLQRFPAPPVNADQLCEDLYTVLQNVSFPKDKSVSSNVDRNNIKDEVECFLNQLPLQDNEKNNTLKKEFVKLLINNLSDLKAKNNFVKNYTNLEGLIRQKFEQFSFNSGVTPNMRELTKDIIQKRDENIRRQIKGQYSDPRELQLVSSPRLSPIERNVQRFPSNIKYQTQTKDIDENNQRTSNIGVHTDMSEFEISMNNLKTKLQKRDENLIRSVAGQYFYPRGLLPKISPVLYPTEGNVQRIPADQNAINIGVQTDMTSEFEIFMHKGIDHDRTSISPVPSKSIQNLDKQNLIKENLRRSRGTTNHEVSPRIVIKEYHWDSTISSQLNNLQPEAHINQNQLRRTVPSLPLAETKIPLAPLEHPKQHINRNPLHRTYSKWPYRLYKSEMNQQTLETVPSPTRMPPSNMNHKYGHECLKLIPINVSEPESFSARNSELRKQKPKFHNDQFTACSRSNLRGANLFLKDAQNNEKISKYKTISRNCIGSIPTNDLDMATINHKDRKHGISHSCCNCSKDKSKKIQDKVTAISNNLNSCHQRTANLAQCVKCHGTACPHPSYFYFS